MLYKKRILVSFILVICLSILISNAMVFASVYSRENKLNQEFSNVQIKQIRISVDHLLNKITQNLIYLSFLYEIQNFGVWYRESNYREKNGFLEDFNPISTINEYYSEAFLVNPDEDIVLDMKNRIFSTTESSRFSSSIESLLRQNTLYRGEESYLTSISGENGSELFLVKPIYNPEENSKSFVFLALNDFIFSEILRQTSLSQESYIMVLGPRGNLLFVKGNEIDSRYIETNLSELIDQNIEDSQTIQIEDEAFYVSHSFSEEFDLTFFYSSSSEIIKRAILDVLMRTFFTSIIIFGFLMIVLRIFTNKIYQPILSVIELLQPGESIDMKDEFQIIQNNISEILENNQVLHRAISENSSFQRSALLKNMVMNDHLESKDIERQIELFSLDILSSEESHYYICACLLRPGEGIENPDKAEIRSGLKGTPFLNNFCIQPEVHYEIFSDSEKVLVFILSTTLSLDMENCFIGLTEETKNSFLLCLSGEQNKLKYLREAYEEAMITLEYRTVTHNESIIFYQNIMDKNHNAFFYPFAMEQKIINSLKQQNRDEVHTNFSLFTKTAMRSLISYQQFKYIFFHLLDSILKLAKDFEIPNEYLLVNPHKGNNWDLVDRMDTTEEIVEFFTEFLNKIIGYLVETQKAPNIKIGQDIKNIIDENFSNRNLSLDYIADALHYSISHISNVFKSFYGETIKNYITVLRLEKAKDLLIHTDQKITTIASEAGYTNIGSFVKIFKAYIGETPKTYRLRIQKK